MRVLQKSDIMFVNSWQEENPCKGKDPGFFPRAVSVGVLRSILQDHTNQKEPQHSLGHCKICDFVKERFALLFAEPEAKP